MAEMIIPGALYLCATPIGNMEDITLRVLRTLRGVDFIAAEDTRNSIKLLRKFNIHTPMTSYHAHNKYDKGRFLIRQLQLKKSIALISDAGTPGISDPGEELVRMCRENDIKVVVLPGAAACIAAVTSSGLPTRRFVFEGFLPTDKKERRLVVDSLRSESRTAILYEAPHRLLSTLNMLLEEIGDRYIVLAHELTKRNESTDGMLISQAIKKYSTAPPKGEWVIIIKGRPKEELEAEKRLENWGGMTLPEHVAYYESQGMDKKSAMKKTACDLGISKRDVYKELI